MKFGVNVPEMHTGRASFLKLGHPQHFLSSNRYIYPLFPTPVAKNPPSNKRTAILCSATIRDAVAEDISVDSGGSPLQGKGWTKVALLVFCGTVWGQAVGFLPRLPSSVLLATAICFYSWAKESLSTTGLVAAWFVFFLTHFSSSVVFAQLLAFFISSSLWTEYKAKTKDKFTVENKKGGKRNWRQVLCNGGLPTLFAVLFGQSVAFQQPDIALSATALSTASVFFFGCCLGSYACCCGDTWASEIGILSKSEPRLITDLRKVPRGTNGGVSLLGLGASAFGGLLIGVTTFVMTSQIFYPSIPHLKAALPYLPFVLLGTVGGLLGSFVDSLLGATLQFSGFDDKLQKVVNYPGKGAADSSIRRITGVHILSNNQVNLLSSLVMALVVGGMTTLFYC